MQNLENRDHLTPSTTDLLYFSHCCHICRATLSKEHRKVRRTHREFEQTISVLRNNHNFNNTTMLQLEHQELTYNACAVHFIFHDLCSSSCLPLFEADSSSSSCVMFSIWLYSLLGFGLLLLVPAENLLPDAVLCSRLLAARGMSCGIRIVSPTDAVDMASAF